jgi:DNA-binding LytR/AlgR family response regulator
MNEARLGVLAVDDEAPALDDLTRLLRSLPQVASVRAVSSGAEALRVLAERRFDVIFLDVRMPGLDGLELARVLRRFERPPAVVFVSAYQTGAVDAFELEALDYLMKPVSRQRLERALLRAAAPARPREAEPEEARGGPDERDVVPVSTSRGATRLVPRASILYLQAQGDYVRIVADGGRYLLRGRISDLERRWAKLGFVRVHRGYIANLARAVEVRPKLNGTAVLVFPGGEEIPVARRKVGELRRELSV